MHYNTLKKKQILKVGIQEAWEFFSNPQNLATITPKELNFSIKSAPATNIYPGQIITYTVSPIMGIPIKWMTEITQVEEPHHFIDNQRMGPYDVWHHQHFFKEVPEGTLMTDLIYYSISPWKLGAIADKLFVRRQLNKIFDYRYQIIEELLNSKAANSTKQIKKTV